MKKLSIYKEDILQSESPLLFITWFRPLFTWREYSRSLWVLSSFRKIFRISEFMTKYTQALYAYRVNHENRDITKFILSCKTVQYLISPPFSFPVCFLSFLFVFFLHCLHFWSFPFWQYMYKYTFILAYVQTLRGHLRFSLYQSGFPDKIRNERIRNNWWRMEEE